MRNHYCGVVLFSNLWPENSKSYVWFTVFVVFESLTLFRKFCCIATLPRLFNVFLCSDLFYILLSFMASLDHIYIIIESKKKYSSVRGNGGNGF